MSQTQQTTNQQPTLTNKQKDTARRLGMTEKQYFEATVAQIKRGKMQAKDIT